MKGWCWSEHVKITDGADALKKQQQQNFGATVCPINTWKGNE